MKNTSVHITYGAQAHAGDIVQFLEHMIAVNQQAEKSGKRKTPVCIWGSHGIGKTELVEDFAIEREFQFAYFAPAQFEEMGDLTGMPEILDEQTHYAPPEWVPRTDGPGILLIDDVNRADDRILRGIMQLLQNYELASWKLPPDWHIILTANPDSGDYSVTPLDDAMLTRMMHITMEFDLMEWIKWAEKRRIDEKAIRFVAFATDLFTGRQTTPRTLVHFFESIGSEKNWKRRKKLIRLLGEASLDSATVAKFLAFIDLQHPDLPSPASILQSKDFQREVYLPLHQLQSQQALRPDILAHLCKRLLLKIEDKRNNISATEIQNFCAFLKMDLFPADLRFAISQDMAVSSNKHVKEVLTDPELTRLLLA